MLAGVQVSAGRPRPSVTAVRIRLTVRGDNRAASSASTMTFLAGRRAHAANSASSMTPTRSQLRSCSAKNVQNTRRSCVYASTVFGERSQPVSTEVGVLVEKRAANPGAPGDSGEADGRAVTIELVDVVDVHDAGNLMGAPDGILDTSMTSLTPNLPVNIVPFLGHARWSRC